MEVDGKSQNNGFLARLRIAMPKGKHINLFHAPSLDSQH